MGGKSAKPDIDYWEYDQRFKKVAQICNNGPAQKRTEQDDWCQKIFYVLLVLFLLIGIISVISLATKKSKDDYYSSSVQPTSASWYHHLETFGLTSYSHATVQNGLTLNHLANRVFHVHQKSDAKQQHPVAYDILFFIVMFALSIAFPIALILGITKYPDIVIKVIVGLITLIILIGIIVGFANGFDIVRNVCLIGGLIWGILIAVIYFCYKKEIKVAQVLLKMTGVFLRKKSDVAFAPLIAMGGIVAFLLLWGGIFYAFGQTTSQRTFFPLVGLWAFFFYFYIYFFYYAMIFLIATAVALWYYGINKSYIKKGIQNIWEGHIGSLTFASISMAILTIIKNLVEEYKVGQQSCSVCCCCSSILRCCLESIEQLLKVLNHNAVITMSITGEGYIDSAKTTIYVIFNNFSQFLVIEIVDTLVNICILFFGILIPVLLASILSIVLNLSDAARICVFVILLPFSYIVCLLLTALLSKSLSAIFMLYCFDFKFKSMIIQNNVPEDLKALFKSIDDSKDRENDTYQQSIPLFQVKPVITSYQIVSSQQRVQVGMNPYNFQGYSHNPFQQNISAYNYQGNQQPSVQGNTSTYNYQGNPQQGNTSAYNYQGNQQPSVQGNTNVQNYQGNLQHSVPVNTNAQNNQGNVERQF